MHTFTQKPRKARQLRPGEFEKPDQAHYGHRDSSNTILRLQRLVGNQAVQQLLKPNGGANVLDARGGGGGGEEVEDQRPETTNVVMREGFFSTVLCGLKSAYNWLTGGSSSTARPTPIAVRNGPTHAPINNGDRVGMSIAITITSSTGNDADMAGIQDSEQVGLSYNHTGSMASVDPLPSNQSGFMPGHPIPDDQHGWSKAAIIDIADNNGGDGSFEKKQLDIYTDTDGGVTAPQAIPSSGYVIKRTIKTSGTKITLKTEKRAEAATVNGYSTTAGPSSTYSDEVTVRE